jgi:hypothetical protein
MGFRRVHRLDAAVRADQKLSPSNPLGWGNRAASHSVGNQSGKYVGASHVVFAGILPGNRAIIGTRMPPS